MAKRLQRRVMMRTRQAIPQAEHELAGKAAAANLEAVAAELAAVPASVAIFMSLGHEIDTMPAIAALRLAGHTILLPRQIGPQMPLDFHLWEPGDTLVTGPFGVREPAASAVRAQPDIIVVPLLAVDRRGYRLGYGGGFYDRTLASLRASGENPRPAVGYGFSLQICDTVPVNETDQRLDRFVHEGGSLTFA